MKSNWDFLIWDFALPLALIIIGFFVYKEARRLF